MTVPRSQWDRLVAQVGELQRRVDAIAPAAPADDKPDDVFPGFQRFRAKARALDERRRG